VGGGAAEIIEVALTSENLIKGNQGYSRC
jgi:hypothetical protein